MIKKEVFDFKPVPRLEQVGDIRSKQVDNHKHCIGRCADSALPRESDRMEFSGITLTTMGDPKCSDDIHSPVGLKLENPLRVFARDTLGLIVWQFVDPRQAACHVADIVRIIRSVQHVVGRAGDLHA